MEWQAIVLAAQILLLATGWLLFQKARGELAARAAEIPVLTEVRALQKSVKELLAEIESTSDRQTARIEEGCSDAAALLARLELAARQTELQLGRYEEAAAAGAYFAYASREGEDGRTAEPAPGDRWALAAERPDPSTSDIPTNDVTTIGDSAVTTAVSRREEILLLADNGETTAAIARATRLSEGEVETVLGLRVSR